MVQQCPLSTKEAYAILRANFAQGEQNRKNQSNIVSSSEVFALMAPIAGSNKFFTHRVDIWLSLFEECSF